MVSNIPVRRFAFRIVLPSTMLVVLSHTLRLAEQEDRTAQEDQKKTGQFSQRASIGESVESIPFFLPLEHSRAIQDAIGLQWPAFVAAGFVAPVPQMHHSGRKEIPLIRASYVALTFTVVVYWFVIGTWLDKRLIQRIPPSHSKPVRIILKVIAVPMVLLLMLFLGKDAVAGWPEGSQGAYGVTAWLGLMSATLLTELGLLLKTRHSNAARPLPPRFR